MGGTNPTAPYVPNDQTADTFAAWKNKVDNNSVAASRIVTRFAPHAQATPNMTVALDAGSIFTGTTLTEIAPQSTATITAPVSNSRIDRIVIDNTTGAVSVVAGTAAASPNPPALPTGKSPVAQVLLTSTTTAITNNLITDERNFGGMASSGFGTQTTLASASTCNLGSITTQNVKITGTTTINSFGSSASTMVPIYMIEFAASLTLTNSAALTLPGGVSIQTQPGDCAIAEYLGSGNWRVRDYTYAAGTSLPTGTSIPWNGIFEPTWGKFENGQALSRTTFAKLFSVLTALITGTLSSGNATVTGVITDLTGLGLEGAVVEGASISAGTTITSVTSSTITLSQPATGAGSSLRIFPYGNGDGSTTFNLPDSRGRAQFGRDNMGGSAAGRLAGAISGTVLGASGGESAHTLTVNEIPSHTHAPKGRQFNFGGSGGTRMTPDADLGVTGAATTATGGDQPHNTLPPGIVKNWVIVT
ncbi:hypothetical protein [Roseicella sp. DB1501]|uniref:hypothetical protein n=1 Tax=Roseicella sp. DB1501 TaxID=2730925 RepID=UPI0014931D9E|nr:hypothetical protein [Roseicella sp. DB1501]NOG70514.1 hypothetical protein [Roseicella sp. DB1501]